MATPNVAQVVQAIREELDTILQEKTAWGRNELKQAFEKAVANALMRFM